MALMGASSQLSTLPLAGTSRSMWEGERYRLGVALLHGRFQQSRSSAPAELSWKTVRFGVGSSPVKAHVCTCTCTCQARGNGQDFVS